MTNSIQGKILVVDDDQDLREVIATDFERLGYQTATAENGLAAISALEQNDFDVIVTDLRMPQLGGMGLYKKLIEIKPSKMPVTIFVTGFSDVNIVDALDIGVSDYIEKPFSRKNLISSVEWHLKSNATRWAQKNAVAAESKNFVKRDYLSVLKGLSSGQLKIGRGGFTLVLDRSDCELTPDLIFKFEISFSESGEVPWLGFGRVRWVKMAAATTLGVEVLTFEEKSAKAFLALQAQEKPRAYIPKI